MAEVSGDPDPAPEQLPKWLLNLAGGTIASLILFIVLELFSYFKLGETANSVSERIFDNFWSWDYYDQACDRAQGCAFDSIFVGALFSLGISDISLSTTLD